MATPQSVLDKVLDAANEAAVMAGQPTFSEQIMQLADELAQVKDANVALQATLAEAKQLVVAAIEADTVADQQEAARFNALLARLPQ